MTLDIYDLTDRPKLTFTTRDDNGTLTNPETLTFYMTEPDGTQTVYVYGVNGELVRASTGVHYVYWDITQTGSHYFDFVAEGNIGVAEPSYFYVRESLAR